MPGWTGSTRESQQRYVATHPWVTKLMWAAEMVATAALGVVTAILATGGFGSPEPATQPAGGVSIVAIMTGAVLALAALQYVLYRVLVGFRRRRGVRRVLESGGDEAEIEWRAGFAYHESRFLAVVILGVIGQFGLIVCILVALVGEPPVYYLNALWAAPVFLYGVARFPTAADRARAIEAFRREVRRRQEESAAVP